MGTSANVDLYTDLIQLRTVLFVGFYEMLL